MGTYITISTAVIITGKPSKWLPQSCSNKYSGFPSSADIRNIKFVSSSKLINQIGMTIAKSSKRYLCKLFTLGANSPEAVRTTGYKTRSIWMVKLCKCIKFPTGNAVQDGNSNAAIAPGIQIVYKKPLMSFEGFHAWIIMMKILILQRWKGK